MTLYIRNSAPTTVVAEARSTIRHAEYGQCSQCSSLATETLVTCNGGRSDYILDVCHPCALTATTHLAVTTSHTD